MSTRGATPGARLRAEVADHPPVQVVGTINAYCALLAQRAGHRALYVSGAGVANASYGLPDLGMTGLADVLTDVRRITGVTDLPVLVDADTGWGQAFSVARTARELGRAGAAGLHVEDQVAAKRCGHRPGKALVDTGEMVDRIKAAVDGRADDDFVVMARTDALAGEGLERALDRVRAYVAAGADMVFAEACRRLDDYRAFVAAAGVPVLANVTEFGLTPLLTVDELAAAGVGLVLYPLTAFRAMSAAAAQVYEVLRVKGGQADLVDRLQTRAELYEVLGYADYERRLDRLFGAPEEEER